MRFSKTFGSALISASILAPALLAGTAARADDAPPPAAAPKETLRVEVGKPLQAAQALMKEKKYKEALVKIQEAEAVPARTPYENFIIDQMRGAAAANDGQDELALTSFESVVNSGRLPPADNLRMIQAISATYFNRLKNYSKASFWAQRYIKDGGTDPVARDILINSQYLAGDYAGAITELKAIGEADEKAGRTTSEQHLLLLLSCYSKQNNSAGAGGTLEQLLVSYPKKEYWDQAISRLQHRNSFPERLDLDLYRLRFELKDLKRESEYMDMGQLALEAGFPAEAKKVVDQGFAAGIMGKGAEAERHKRLRDLVDKDSVEDQKSIGAGDVDAEKAKTGDGLLNAGYNYVLNGKFEKGLALMEQGIHKGGLKHPEDAKMHLGIAYFLAGDKAKAAQILRTVQGSDGVGDLAHLWAVYVGRG
jgi:outer membrane protein assembly factor BamD (BamD/ComL family)